MNPIFADTFFYLALVSRRDAAHAQAVDWSRRDGLKITTTAWVLTEVVDALSAPARRATASKLINELTHSPHTLVVPSTHEWFDLGWQFFQSRGDKHWTLTDCISFMVMERHRLTEALTGDHHFEQAGFRALLNQ
jgi:uncharacterized protein